MSIFSEIEQKFKSGNDVPVSRVVITREEFEKIKERHDEMIAHRVELAEQYRTENDKLLEMLEAIL